MEEHLKLENKQFRRNKWAYSLGGIGRDMTYTLVATFFMTYIQFSGLGLTVAQFSVISILLVIGRVWDAVNDPMMGAIIENTKSRWGKFKPWILIGAVLTAIIIILMFNYRPTGNDGWNFVIFFGVIYLLWEIAFTMNDISYWSMLPSLTNDSARRNSVTTLAVVFAGVGAFAANAAISFLTVGNAVKGYSMISIVIAIFLVGCQALTVFGVRQPILDVTEKEEYISIKKMVRVIKRNDQLLWVILAMLLYNIGSGLFVALGYNFIYLELGYNGTLALIFVASFGVSNIGTQIFYPKLAKKFGRKKLLYYSFIVLALGYLFIFLLGFVPFLPINIFTIVLFGVLVFGGQAIFYMILTVNITNTVEYNEYKTYERNESVIFSLRPFMAKMASALQQGLVVFVLVSSGIFILSKNIDQLENQKNIFDNLSTEEKLEFKENVKNRKVIFDGEEYRNYSTDEINKYYDILQQVKYETIEGKEVMNIINAADKSFKDQATNPMRLAMRIAVTIAPTILIFFSYYVLKKKYIIDEEVYDEMIREIKSRKVA